MTKQEIERMFLDGEKAIKYFYQCEKYEIGGKRITVKQFKSLTETFKNQSSFCIESGGWTKHIYKYKPENSLDLSTSETK